MAANTAGPDECVAPPGPARTGTAAARAASAEFVVLSRSDELLEQLGQALDGAGEVRHAESEDEARQCFDRRHAAVLLLDSREHTDPGLAVERLHASDGTTVIVVFAPADAATDVARAIKGSAAFAVLPIPIEVEKTRVVLHGAGEEAMARRSLVSSAEAPRVTTLPGTGPRIVDRVPGAPVVASRPGAARSEAAPSPTQADIPTAVGGTRRPPGIPRLALAVLVGLSVAAVAAWIYLRDGTDVPASVNADAGRPLAAPGPGTAGAPTPEGPQPLEVELSTEPKEALLDLARAAFHERRYTDPEGNNALHFYRSVLAQDPLDGEAREGLLRIGGVLDERLETAMAENSFDAALRTLQQLRLVRPDDPALAEAEARLAERRIGAALARGDVELAADLLRGAERAGVPARRLLPLREQLARVDDARHAERAARAAAQRRGAEAEQSLAEARARGYTPDRPVAAGRQETPAPPVAPLTMPGPVAGPAPTTAGPGAAAPAAEPVPASEFRRTRYVAPTYPPQALARGLSGEVRVRLTIDADGRVADVQVLSASPAGVFEQAAINSVRKWRFEPILRDGRAVEASVATKISFQADSEPRR